MRARGITYDTGFINAGTTTREGFDPEVVRREMTVIRDELSCTAVRPTGGDVERLDTACAIAAELGLEVWFSPFTCDLTPSELLDFLAECSERAERIRMGGGDVVLVTGAEVSLFTRGFLPGESIVDRLQFLPAAHALEPFPAEVSESLSEFLWEVAAICRARFGGKLGYASLWAEQPDWTPFDFVGIDAYCTQSIAGRYREALRSLRVHGKPVAVTEFGSSTYRGSSGKGALAEDVVVWEGERPVRLARIVERDETEQADAIERMHRAFVAEDIDTSFVHTFGFWHMPHHQDAERDLDRVGFGIVRPLQRGRGSRYPEMRWEPKESFDRVARLFGG